MPPNAATLGCHLRASRRDAGTYNERDHMVCQGLREVVEREVETKAFISTLPTYDRMDQVN